MKKIIVAALAAAAAIVVLAPAPSFAGTRAGVDIYIGPPAPPPYYDPYYPPYDQYGRPICTDPYGYRVPCYREPSPPVIVFPIPIPGGGRHHHH